MEVPPFSLDQQLSLLGPELDAAVLKVLRSGHYIGGREVQAFEESFARNIGVSHVVGCNSGTDALILALRALGIGAGDEVITASFSFFATAEAISNVGATPVFVDVDPKNYLINLDEIEKAITPATKAIIPVHLFGCPVDMTRLMQLAKDKKLKVIEDCAQAAGSEWGGRSLGAWGDVGCFSFFPTKNLGAGGDAGAITTQDLGLAQRIRELAVHGMPQRYVHTNLGYNSRLDALQAVILNVKLPNLQSWVKQRQSIAQRYHELLKDVKGIELPCNAQNIDSKHAWNQFVIKVISCPKNKEPSDEAINFSEISANSSFRDSRCRDWLKESLKDKGVNTIIYYPIPIHLQPAYKQFGYKSGHLPVTERLCNQVLSLPIFPEISLEQQSHVVSSLKNLLGQSNEAKISVIAKSH